MTWKKAELMEGTLIKFILLLLTLAVLMFIYFLATGTLSSATEFIMRFF